MAQTHNLIFEKGQPYVGQDTDSLEPVDMTKPEFAGLRDVVSEQNIQSGQYRWVPDEKTLIPVDSARGGTPRL